MKIKDYVAQFLSDSKLKHLFRGMGSILDIFPAPLELDDRDPEIIDAEAIASDWEAVENDLHWATQQFEKEENHD